MSSSSFFSVGIVTHADFAHHLTGSNHPESPKRMEFIIQRLMRDKLLTKQNVLSPRGATTDEISLAHNPDYIKVVEFQSIRIKENYISPLSTGDVMISNRSFEIAKLAVGAVLNAIDAVFNKQFDSVFCVIRPPGHHACQAIGMGFCIFNNVAIGAFYALKNYPIERVLIVDWDLHHGNGTEELVKNDPRIFYFSTHESPLYPGTGSENEHGVNNNVMNIEIKAGPRSREQLLDAYLTALPDAMEVFQPELILISAGFDAHKDDPLGHLLLTAEDFGTLTRGVKKIAHRFAKGRIVSVLEGGYNLEAIAHSASEHVKALTS